MVKKEKEKEPPPYLSSVSQTNIWLTTFIKLPTDSLHRAKCRGVLSNASKQDKDIFLFVFWLLPLGRVLHLNPVLLIHTNQPCVLLDYIHEALLWFSTWPLY